MLLSELKKASAEELSKKVYGFDDKMVITPGFTFTFGADELVYTEPSGFSRENPDTKAMEPIDTFYVARQEGEKIVALNLATLVRQTLPNGAFATGIQAHSTYQVGKVYPPLVQGKKNAGELVKSLAGRTITLLAIVPYNATSAKGKPYSGKQYIWA